MGSRALDDAFTAIEHVKAFAGPLGVKLLLENLNQPDREPECLAEIVRMGHLDSVGFCLDLGHAVLEEGVPETSHAPAQTGIDLAFAAFGDRLTEVHVHDNGISRDDHLWPGEGKIDFGRVREHLRGLKKAPSFVLEVGYEHAGAEREWQGKSERAWELVQV